MIDTHCHLLPGIDDGPRSEAESVRLARRLSAEGITTVVCTPHFSERFPTSSRVACDRHERLRTELDAVGIELETTVAAEVSPGRALATALPQLATRAIAGQFVMVELVRDTAPATALEICARLSDGGLVPLLAHPERCSAVQSNISLVDDLREAGAWIQVVASSLAGRWGHDTWASAWALVDSGRADLLASDAHRAQASTPRLDAVADLVERRCGRGRRRELTESAPGRLLSGHLKRRTPDAD